MLLWRAEAGVGGLEVEVAIRRQTGRVAPTSPCHPASGQMQGDAERTVGDGHAAIVEIGGAVLPDSA